MKLLRFSTILPLVLFFFRAQVAIAQTVPPSPILWLEADKGVVLENGRVAQWQDQSGNGNDVRMDSADSRPFYSDSVRPAVVFQGWNYLQGPNIFPANNDYTIAVATKINNLGAINNLVSGNVHALYLANDSFPRIVHYWFQHQEVSPVPVWGNGFSSIIGLYNQSYQQATLYVNGRYADSAWVLTTADSTLYIGSYLGGYFLQGEITEVLMYNRKLDSSELSSLQNYLMSKYSIPQANPLPKQDNTMTAFPSPFQMYARGSDDSATVPITGTIYKPGFDSVYLLQFKNESTISRLSQPLVYQNGEAGFQFSPRIHAELSEYRFDVHLVAKNFDSVIAHRDSVACGDIYFMDGQGISYKGWDDDTFRNEYCRSLGPQASENLFDTLWYESDNDVGAADQRIQQDLMAYQHMPTCTFNESVGGTDIELHFRNDSDKYDLRTIYGRTLYRATITGMRNSIKIIFWCQGEANYAPGYYQKFLKLYNAWKEDYPGLQKVYLLQIRPNGCDFGNIDMRDVQRWMGDSIASVEPIASAAIPLQNRCEYYDSGYKYMGDRFYLELARDFYHATDTANLRSPNAIWAWWTHPDHSEVAILFSPHDAIIHATNDTTVGGIFAALKDYLYPNDTSCHVTSFSFDNDTMFLELDHPGATWSIAYLPDQWYSGSLTAVYEGPWIVNQRGFGVLLWHVLPIADQPFSGVGLPSSSRLPQIIPNPTTHSISLDVSSLSGPLHAELMNEMGVSLWKKTLSPDGNHNIEIDVSNSPAGTYFLHITDNHSSMERKFVLER